MSPICCLAFKNPVPRDEPKFTELQLHPHFSLKVGVRCPSESDYLHIENSWERDFAYESTVDEAKRLVDILRKCSLFDDVRLIDSDELTPDIILVAISRPRPPGDPDAGMAGIYLGVVPVYMAYQEGIYFKFTKGGTGEFRFDWLEEDIFSIFSVGIAAVSKKWQLTPSGSTYWEELRESLVELIRTSVPNAQQYES